MKMLLNIITIVCLINTVALSFLTVIYLRGKKDNLEDEGTANTNKKN